MLGSISEQSGESVVKKKIAYGGKDLQKKVLSMERKSQGCRNTNNNKHKG